MVYHQAWHQQHHAAAARSDHGGAIQQTSISESVSENRSNGSERKKSRSEISIKRQWPYREEAKKIRQQRESEGNLKKENK